LGEFVARRVVVKKEKREKEKELLLHATTGTGF
jgi:hypothetical protein